jgi:hypothetical protein
MFLSAKPVVDRAIAAYLDWREACVAVSVAYDHWFRAPSAHAAVHYDAYSAALDREARAAEIYAEAATARRPVVR